LPANYKLQEGVEGSTCWKISPLLPAPSYRLLARGGERGEYVFARIMEGGGVDHRKGKEKGKCLKQEILGPDREVDKY
jgi:hypothetical protein